MRNDPKHFETLSSAAKRWGINERTVRRAIADQRLEAFRLGRVIRLDPTSVDALFTSTLHY